MGVLCLVTWSAERTTSLDDFQICLKFCRCISVIRCRSWNFFYNILSSGLSQWSNFCFPPSCCLSLPIYKLLPSPSVSSYSLSSSSSETSPFALSINDHHRPHPSCRRSDRRLFHPCQLWFSDRKGSLLKLVTYF